MSNEDREMIGWTEEDVVKAKRNRQAVKTFHKKWFTDQKKPIVKVKKKKRKRRVKKPSPKPKKQKLVWPKEKNLEKKKGKGSQT